MYIYINFCQLSFFLKGYAPLYLRCHLNAISAYRMLGNPYPNFITIYWNIEIGKKILAPIFKFNQNTLNPIRTRLNAN